VTSFTEVFGGSVVSPTDVEYAKYTISTSITLSWPFEADPGTYLAAGIVDIVAMSAGLSVTMPSALIVSVGQGVLFRNAGGNLISILDNAGNVITTIASGQAWFVWITDNTTAGGMWGATQFGAATSTANAASLAGAGLQAVITLLNQNLVINSQISDYALGPGDRATVVRNTGGSVTYTPAVAGPGSTQLPNGWFVYLINNGSGALTFSPQSGQTIDGSSTKVLAPTESAVFFSDGSNFWTLGYGRSLVTTVTATNIALPPVGTVTLTSTQVAAQVQNYTGALSGNVIVNMGAGSGYWFVWNHTTGPFSVTFRVNGSDPGVIVPQGSFSILRSDGSNVNIAFTSTTGTVTEIDTTADLTGGPITTTGTLGLSNTGVSPGTYGALNTLPTPASVPIVTVDQKGRLTAAGTYNLGTAASVDTGTVSGTIPVLGSDNNVNPLNGGVPVGACFDYIATSAPAGYILAFGTIGNGASAASNRANADQANLFALIWNNWTDAQAPVSGGRGASAAADFAANKTIAVPDLRGRVVAGLDNMGGVAAGRLTSTTMTPNGVTPGATGGTQTATVSGTTSGTLSVSGTTADVSGILIHVPSTFQGNFGGGGANVDGLPPGGVNVNPFSGTLGVTGATSGSLTVAGTAPNVQPTLVMSKIIKY